MGQVREALATPEVVHVDVPPEPPAGSVGLDREGVAWQARASASGPGLVWERAGSLARSATGSLTPVESKKTWPRLLAENGPVTLIYRPE